MKHAWKYILIAIGLSVGVWVFMKFQQSNDALFDEFDDFDGFDDLPDPNMTVSDEI